MPDKVTDKMDLRRRTNGEELWLYRRAQARANGGQVTQADAARVMGVCEKQYWKAERDLVELKAPVRTTPTLGDLCALARRRHGKGLAATARKFRVSAPTLLGQEKAGHPALVRAWEAIGYVF